MKPIEYLVNSVVKCTKCGKPYGTCLCWVKCACGWLYENGGQCKNPIHYNKTQFKKTNPLTDKTDKP